MTLSAKVAQQEQEVDALYASMYPKDGAPAAEPKAAVETPPVVDASPAASVADTPPVAEPAKPLVPDLAPASEETWERRFKVLQGKYHAEVPRLKTQLDALAAEVKASKAAASAPAALVTEAEVEKYGPEFIDMVQRAADQKFGTERAAHAAEIAALKDSVAALTDAMNRTSNLSFDDHLSKLAPDWKAIDADKDWLGWLQEYDPVARTQRQVLLNDAIATGDAPYVADAIQRWKAQKPKERTAPAPARSLDELAQPSGSDAPDSPAPTARVWTPGEVDQFYKDVRSGKYTDAEQAHIEQEILNQARRQPK